MRVALARHFQVGCSDPFIRPKWSGRRLRQMCDQLRFVLEGDHTRGGQMDILVIEGTAARRVTVAQYLLRATHRVTTVSYTHLTLPTILRV